jgi:antitoxin (DNA-binding transcriptional repressor) of toxin-antitoxin stability system
LNQSVNRFYLSFMYTTHPAATVVGAHDAKTRLAELLDRVERGEEVIITRHGRPVAKLSRTGPGHNVAAARVAAAALMKLREEIAEEAGGPFSLSEILALRDDGRRY